MADICCTRIQSDPAVDGAGRIVVFGTYQIQDHPRVGVLAEGLAARGYVVTEVNEPLGLTTAERVSLLREPWRLPVLAARLVQCWWRLWRRGRAVRDDVDAVLVGYLGHFDVHLARRVFRGVPIVLDHLIFAAGTAADRGVPRGSTHADAPPSRSERAQGGRRDCGGHGGGRGAGTGRVGGSSGDLPGRGRSELVRGTAGARRARRQRSAAGDLLRTVHPAARGTGDCPGAGRVRGSHRPGGHHGRPRPGLPAVPGPGTEHGPGDLAELGRRDRPAGVGCRARRRAGDLRHHAQGGQGGAEQGVPGRCGRLRPDHVGHPGATTGAR